MNKLVKLVIICLLIVFFALIGQFIKPELVFSYHMRYGQFSVWSDQNIEPNINFVLDDALQRINKSQLYDRSQLFNIFFCNNQWKLALFSLRFSGKMAGAAETVLTNNIYIRESDIHNNQIIPPSRKMLDPKDRPLSYFIAHEATHVMQARKYGRFLILRPTWIREGYADYVAKGNSFDFKENLRLLRLGDTRLDPERSGLYRKYNLEVAWLLDYQGWTTDKLHLNPPRESEVISSLKSGNAREVTH